tara:strand:- start:1697 stop:2449 length:753 start_codon:yes stop_codon:yes gene_type:complete
MKIRILGSGASFGSPLAYGRNGNIDINNPHNFRTRSSILVEINNTNFLFDTSPDLRQQLYDAKCTNVDAVFYTHEHSDHVSGLPDMRAISLINKKIIPAYIPDHMINKIRNHYRYIFDGEGGYQPFMSINKLEQVTEINNVKINTFKHNHGSIDVQTYKINNFAYTTDFKKFYNNDIDKLLNLDLWIVGLLRYDKHSSHASLSEILELIHYLKPKKTILTHMTALLDEKELIQLCPENVIPGYDGMIINI